MAQLAALLICNQGVMGSNPIPGSPQRREIMSDKTMMVTTVITSLTALVGAGTVFIKKLKVLKKAIMDLERDLFHANNTNVELTKKLAVVPTTVRKTATPKKAAPKKTDPKA